MDESNIFYLIDDKLKNSNVEIPSAILEAVKSDFWSFAENLPDTHPILAETFTNDTAGLLMMFRLWLGGRRNSQNKLLLRSSFYFMAILIAIPLSIIFLFFQPVLSIITLGSFGLLSFILYKKYHLSKEHYSNAKEMEYLYNKIYNSVFS